MLKSNKNRNNLHMARRPISIWFRIAFWFSLGALFTLIVVSVILASHGFGTCPPLP